MPEKRQAEFDPIYLLRRAWDISPPSLSDLSPGMTRKGHRLFLQARGNRLRAFSSTTGDSMHSTPTTTPTTKLLMALQWALTGFGLFCLVGAVVVMALTPEAWPV
ncbi:cobalamin synthase [Comamonas sp. E6]|nr:cobalamin synthase [Comamonas sp. E6]